MMRVRLLIIALAVLSLSLGTGTAFSATAPTTPPAGTPGTAECTFSALKNSLWKTESSKDVYKAFYINKKTGASAWGKYQFIPETRATYINRNPQCKPSNGQPASWCNNNQNFISQPCYQVQECLADAMMRDNLNQIKKDPACQQLLANGGKQITGSGQGKTLTCNVSLSGLMAAFHLGGWDECRKILKNGHGDKDSLGTETAYYTCRHKDLPLPGNCTPTPTNTSGDIPGPTSFPNMEGGGDFGLDLSGPLDPLRDWWDASLMLMADQLTAHMEAQVGAIGKLFDAKHQLETQRLMQEKTAEAHKDYQPSEQMCTFGTFTRDLMTTERTTLSTKTAIAERLLERDVGQGDGVGISRTAHTLSRIDHFRKRFCDQNDNALGLTELCPQSAPANMRNRDINYTQTVDQPLSLDINLNDSTLSEDEESVFALIDNLFASTPLPRSPDNALEQRKFNYNYLNLRSITAMRGIARNSIANIIALKTATPNRDDQTNAPYLRALLREFGMSDDEVRKQLGPNPSYYAQMEFLTRKIYQNPNFYSNLYDKPANVARLRAAMKAVKLMQDRDIQAALQRRELLFSMLLELRLRTNSEDVYDSVERGLFSSEMGSGTDAGEKAQ